MGSLTMSLVKTAKLKLITHVKARRLVQVVNSYKPSGLGSHWTELCGSAELLDEAQRLRGHDVYTFMSDDDQDAQEVREDGGLHVGANASR